jgi:hypothetical protein
MQLCLDRCVVEDQTFVMPDKKKLAEQQAAAKKVAEIMLASLEQLPKKERQLRAEAIQKVKISRGEHDTTPKRPSTQVNLRERPQVAVARRKRAHR